MIPKFRVWDKDHKYMEYTDKNLVVCFSKEGLGAVDHTTFGHSCTCMEDIELMQSTGLKDKNGTEIYEGDIVDFDGFHEIRFGIHGVPRLETEKYVDTATGFYFKPQHDLKDVKPFNLDIPLNDRYANECVVVGNIYQHPHLLEEDNHASN